MILLIIHKNIILQIHFKMFEPETDKPVINKSNEKEKKPYKPKPKHIFKDLVRKKNQK